MITIRRPNYEINRMDGRINILNISVINEVSELRCFLGIMTIDKPSPSLHGDENEGNNSLHN